MNWLFRFAWVGFIIFLLFDLAVVVGIVWLVIKILHHFGII